MSVTPALNEDGALVDSGAKEEGENTDEKPNRAVDVEKANNTFQEKAKHYLIDQTSQIVIPSFAKWFNMNEIHSIEKKLFPDFFSVKDSEKNKSVYKTPEIYKNMRDFMVNTYRINPLEYLTITAVRRSLAGDVTTIIRVHRFLEKWGLINYQIDPRTKPMTLGPQYTGHFVVTLDTPRGLVPFIPENVEISSSSKLPSPPSSVEPENMQVDEEVKQEEEEDKKREATEIPLNIEVRSNVYQGSKDSSNLATQNIIQYFCNTCNNETSEVRYHNLKSKSFTNNPNSTVNNASIICANCYEQGLFPLNFKSSDFVKMTKSTDPTVWNEQEVLLLLEAIEMFGTYDVNSNVANVNLNSNTNGQWDKIAEYVGTKSKEECITKFILLPIEERYLNKLVKPEKEKENFNKEILIKDIVEEIISRQSGDNTLRDNSVKSLQETITEQSNIINQIMELTLEKVQVKLKSINELETNLLKMESTLDLERKQVLFERWANFERIQKFLKSHPELSQEFRDLLTELQKPISPAQIRAITNTKVDGETNNMSVDMLSDQAQKDADTLPISVSKPKSYQFWSG